MAARNSLPLAGLFLLVLVACAVPATAGGEYSGARMVIIRGPETRVVGGAAASAQSNKWWQHYRRLVEDEVAPELSGLLGAGEGGIGYGALDKDGPACPPSDKQRAVRRQRSW